MIKGASYALKKGFSPTTLKTPSKSPMKSIRDKIIYEHYQNGVYMGSKRDINKFGVGIALYDNDTCAILDFNSH